MGKIKHQPYREKTMKVGNAIDLTVKCSARIIGRTYEEDPRVDVITPWGVLNGIPLSVLKTMMAGEMALPANVEPIRQQAKRTAA